MATPTVWFVGAGIICLVLFIGAVQIKHAAKVEGARVEGIAIGKGESSTAALEAASETAAAERAAAEETPVLAVRDDIIALCKRSASCRERRTLK